MKHNNAVSSFLRQTLKDDSGQVLPWMAMVIVLLTGASGLALDLGRAYTSYRELQTSTDAAALAGAYEMSLTTATQTSLNARVNSYSSVSPGLNVNPNLPSAKITPTIKCLTSVTASGVLCGASPLGGNALQVVQTATVPTMFIRVLGVLKVFGLNPPTSLTLRATATAAMRGAQNSQYNVAMVVDTTASMGSTDTDASCGKARITCALTGVQTMLTSLTPCTAASVAAGSCTGFDQVSLFTYPAVQANTAKNDTACPSSNPTTTNYPVPIPPPTSGGPPATWTPTDFTKTTPTYQLTPYLTDYSSTNLSGGTVNTSSALGIATGSGVGTKKSPCNGVGTPGGEGTYFAGVIYAALSSLAAAQAANPSSSNALIILSDGDADSSDITGATNNGNNPGSAQDQCQQAVTAAATANNMTRTTVYSIAYGASSSGCASDVYNKKTNASGTNITPCQTMTQMASSAATFYSDATASANPGQCISASNPSLTLDQIFKQVATQFTVARLIPDGSS